MTLPVDPFEVLGLPKKFALTEVEIDARVRELQKVLHPDKHATAGPAERRQAMARAVTVNEAARALRDEVSRAVALLRARGAKGEVEETASAAFLMEMMELRESLAEAKAGGDAGALEKLGAKVRGEVDTARAEIRSALDDGGVADEATAAVSRLRYYRRFLDEHAAATDALVHGGEADGAGRPDGGGGRGDARDGGGDGRGGRGDAGSGEG